ncbi:MAG: hypothetical protein AB8H86_19915 [Polyangiales bacterium]
MIELAQILDADTSGRLTLAKETGRLSPVVAVLAPLVFDKEVSLAESVALALVDELTEASSAALRALDRDFRSPAFLAKWPTCSTLSDAEWARRESLSGDASLAALTIACLGRAGRKRERACHFLGRRPEALCFALLVLRLNDPFESTRHVAREALQHWLTPARIVSVSRYSPLVESASAWQWAGGSRVDSAFFALLDQNEGVLLAQTRHKDPRVRLSAYRRLGHVRADSGSIEEVLRPAITDASPRIRAWARITTNAKSTPKDVRQRLARLMLSNRSPRTREMALRLLRSADDIADILMDVAFDANAGVRFVARASAQKLNITLPSRKEAIEALAQGTQLVGALALLSDYGGQSDAALVRPFTEHSNRRVRVEARRTLSLLLA